MNPAVSGDFVSRGLSLSQKWIPACAGVIDSIDIKTNVLYDSSTYVLMEVEYAD